MTRPPLWRPQGQQLKPVYHASDLEGLEHLDGRPGQAPFVRGPYPGMYTESLGHCANTLVLPALKRAISACAKASRRALKVCRWPSTCRPIAATTPPIHSVAPMWAKPALP